MLKDLELHKRIHQRVEYDYDIDGEGCTLWQGPLKNGSPYIWYKGREQNLRRIITGEHDRRIRLTTYCGKERCINPAHVIYSPAGKTYTVKEIRAASNGKCPKGHNMNGHRRCMICRRDRKKQRNAKAHRI